MMTAIVEATRHRETTGMMAIDAEKTMAIGTDTARDISPLITAWQP
jgi:hypothetical protein